jgi:hypothetical protein
MTICKHVSNFSFLSCPEGDEYDSDSTGESLTRPGFKKSGFDEFKEEIKHTRKAFGKNFCAEFENIHKSSLAFEDEEDEVDYYSMNQAKFRTTNFREDLNKNNNELLNVSNLAFSRKGSILRRLESNHSEINITSQ